MKIILNKIYVFNENSSNKIKKLIESSYREWSDSLINNDENLATWKAEFSIMIGDNIFPFIVDTENEYLIHLDLDGYINGESLEFNNDTDIKILNIYSGMVEAILYSEICRFQALSRDLGEDIYHNIFPEWANGFAGRDLDQNPLVREFTDRFMEYFHKVGYLKIIKPELDSVEIIGSDNKDIDKQILDYINKEIRFILTDKKVNINLSELTAVGNYIKND